LVLLDRDPNIGSASASDPRPNSVPRTVSGAVRNLERAASPGQLGTDRLVRSERTFRVAGSLCVGGQV